MWRELSLGIGLRAPGCGKHNTRSPLLGILKFYTELDSAIVRVLYGQIPRKKFSSGSYCWLLPTVREITDDASLLTVT